MLRCQGDGEGPCTAAGGHAPGSALPRQHGAVLWGSHTTALWRGGRMQGGGEMRSPGLAKNAEKCGKMRKMRQKMR